MRAEKNECYSPTASDYCGQLTQQLVRAIADEPARRRPRERMPRTYTSCLSKRWQ